MSACAAAEEALGTDPRDININLRSVLQTSQSAAFTEQSVPAEPVVSDASRHHAERT